MRGSVAPSFRMTPRRVRCCLLWSVLLSGSAALVGCSDSERMRAPAVVQTSPADGATQVPNTTVVTAVFDQAMNPAALSTESFTIACPGSAAIAADVDYDSAARAATLTPQSPLPADVTCTATISTAVRNAFGVALASSVAWSFATTFDAAMVEQGKQTFRFDTFGDET